MATYLQGILGPFSGKVGTVVGYISRGKAIMRSLSKSSKKLSPAQKISVNKMSYLSKKLHLFKEAINYGYTDDSQRAAWNMAVQANYQLLEPDGDLFQLTPEAIKLSNGSETFNTKLTRTGDALNIAWTAPTAESPFYGATGVLALHNPDNGRVLTQVFPLSSGEADFTISAYLADNDTKLHAYTFVSTGTLSSSSLHSII